MSKREWKIVASLAIAGIAVTLSIAGIVFLIPFWWTHSTLHYAVMILNAVFPGSIGCFPGTVAKPSELREALEWTRAAVQNGAIYAAVGTVVVLAMNMARRTQPRHSN